MEDSKPASSTAKAAHSLLENVVELRFLLLFLCFAFYLDIWLVEARIDPTNLSISTAYASLLTAPIFTVLLFIGSYSLLMIGLFPALRLLITWIRFFAQSMVRITNHTKESKQLSDWSTAFVCLSVYDVIVGYSANEEIYKGLANFIFNVLLSDGFGELIFRIGAVLFWIYCLSQVFAVDDFDFN